MRLMSLLVFVGLGLAPIGCGKGTPATSLETLRRSKLQDVWEAYSFILKSKGRPPTDLKDMAETEGSNQAAWAVLNTGECVLFYGGAAGTDSGIILAYEKETPTAGGKVLMQNGQIKEMAAAEFAAAPKVGKK